MADVFISYSRRDRALTEALARDLEARGATVWWDTALVSGESFRTAILTELARARAVIVVWTRDSVGSDWVLSEATRAHARRVLVSLRSPALEPDQIPPPFDVLHTDLVTNVAAIEAALKRYGVTLSAPGEKDADETAPPPIRRRVLAAALGLAAIAAGGALGYRYLGPGAVGEPPPIAWSELPAGTRLANVTASDVATFSAPDRTAGRSLAIRPGQVVPASGLDDILSRSTVRSEAWLRFPLGDGVRFAHVPETDIRLMPPR